ncbi:MAG: hypothetical protein ACK4IS_00935 [Erythrobacter sp.]
MTLQRSIAPVLALAALAQASAAQAQQACVPPADLGDTIIYTLPIAYDAARTSCAKEFARDGFVARSGEKFIAGFRARQNAAWPGAMRTLQAFLAGQQNGGKGSDLDMAALVKSLPPEALRPLVDGLMGQMIADEIKPETCGKIERGLELMSPLPVDNVAGLMGFMLELADLKEPSICPADLAKKQR